MNTIKGSELPLVCPVCDAKVVTYSKGDDDNYEGAMYNCGLDLYLDSGDFMLERPCITAIWEWVSKRNDEVIKRRAEDRNKTNVIPLKRKT